MTERTSSALVRLAALAVMLLLAASFACRPAWSPDGRKLLFPVQLPGPRIAIALHDRDTGTTSIVFMPTDREHSAVPLWAPDGKRAVIIESSSNQQKIFVTTLTIPPSGAGKTVEVTVDKDPSSSLIVPAAFVGGRLFLTAQGIVRIDLDTGEVKRREPEKRGCELVVTCRGSGLCYVAMGRGKDEYDWELGTVDPETLQLTPLLTAPADRRWKVVPVPAFSRDLRRIALLAGDRSKEEQSILVFADGKVEAVLPLGPETEVGCGSVEWAPDGATLLVSLCRRNVDAKLDTWCLYETTISGSVSRETRIVEAASDRDREVSGFLMPMALSPDGRMAAFSTAMLELDAEHHGLWLVDLAHKDRKATRVPFPPSTELRLMGSDALYELGTAWSEAFPREHVGVAHVPVEVSGGGSGEGISALIAGEVELALTTRPAMAAELARAKQDGVVLAEHRVGFEALAICVHKDNPIASLTLEQLARVFGQGAGARWSELGVTLPEEHDTIVRAGLRGDSAAYPFFRETVLGNGPANLRTRHLAGSADVARFVSGAPGRVGWLCARTVDDSVKVVPIVGTAGAAAVLPGPATIADASYALARPLFLSARAEPPPHVAQFLAWLASDPGRKVTEQAGFFAAR